MSSDTTLDGDRLREAVRAHYGAGPRAVSAGSAASAPTPADLGACCTSPASGAARCGTDQRLAAAATAGQSDPIAADLYSDTESAELPPAAAAASLGCGNPTALA